MIPSLQKVTVFVILLFCSTIQAETLTWIAVGDDGNVGTATAYDLRMSGAPITEGNWDSCVQIEGEPIPSVAGTREALYYYFALRTVDEAGNWSGLSNVVAVPYDSGVFSEDRGDFNDDGQMDISDLMIYIDYMFPQEN